MLLGCLLMPLCSPDEHAWSSAAKCCEFMINLYKDKSWASKHPSLWARVWIMFILINQRKHHTVVIAFTGTKQPADCRVGEKVEQNRRGQSEPDT